MISYYTPHLLPFLTTVGLKVPSRLKRLFYLSWEDALWDLLPQLEIKRGDTILLPNFYCQDVINNIKTHGYKVALYPLDDNFQVSETKLLSIYNKIIPSIVILFHACGITSSISQNQVILKHILTKSVLIEDSVHRVIDSSKIKLLQGRHLVIDSLRKNIPLPGSFVYFSSDSKMVLAIPHTNSVSYSLKVMIYYGLYRIVLATGVSLHLKSVIKFAHHTILGLHDELVGDSITGNSGSPWISWIHKYINISKVRSHKINQVLAYQKLLQPIIANPKIKIPNINRRDFGELHAFPVIVLTPLSDKIESALLPINVWAKFTDSQWSKGRKAFFLPLGFHITLYDQQLIVKSIIESC